jgi:two-component system phosphate regulon response regulator PhoB
VGDFSEVVMGSTRIVLIEEGPLIERLIALFGRTEPDAAAAQVIARRADSALQRNGERVCEAHILAPNLILLDLSRACVERTEAGQHLHDGPPASDAVELRLAVRKQESGNRNETVSPRGIELEQLVSHLANDDPQSAPLPIPDQSVVTPEPVLQMGPVRIDRHGHWAYLEEKKLHLTPTEFRLLECFLREPGRAFTRSQLLDVSIGNASFVLERTIDVHIRSLRTKLGAARELIETVRGVGYRFRESQE